MASVGDEVFTRGKKSRMVVCFVDTAFKPATSSITDPTILDAWIYPRFFKNGFTSYLSRFLTKRRKQGVRQGDRRKNKQARRAGYGLEIPCVYRLYGPKAYVDRMKEITDSMMSLDLMSLDLFSNESTLTIT